MSGPRRTSLPDRGGVALGLVMALAALLGLTLVPMLFFSGSQTRSLVIESRLWKARYLAMSGLKAAGDKLREERWYGETDVVGELTSEEVGLAGEGRFHVVAEDTRIFSPKKKAGFKSLPLVHHIDVFSRGEDGDRSVVAYAAFIMNPAPELAGKATDGFDGIGETTADTMKRLVRFHFFRDTDLQQIEEQGVRDRIRTRVHEKSKQYIENYAQVDWALKPDPPAPPSPRMSDEVSATYLSQFEWAQPVDPPSLFFRDRVFDMILEGTPATQRAVAQKLRQISIRTSDEAEELRAEAQHFCELVGSCEWGPFVADTELVMVPPNAVGLLHEVRGGIPDEKYRIRLSQHDCARVYYVWGAESTEPATVPTATIEAQYPGSTHERWRGEWWIDYFAVKDEDPCMSAGYYLDDPASGLDVELNTVYGFFKKYFALEEAHALGGLGIDKSDPISMGYSKDNSPPEEFLVAPGSYPPGADKVKRAAF